MTPTKATIQSKASPWVFVERSGIHGNGVFAYRNIPKGTKIIQYKGEKVLKRDSDARFDRDEKNGTTYMFELNNKYYIDGLDKGSDAIYINHACKTNCEIEIENNEIWIIAEKNIKKGEELHYDYAFDYDVADDHPCRCGKKQISMFPWTTWRT